MRNQTEVHLTSKRNGLRLQTITKVHIGALGVSDTVANRESPDHLRAGPRAF
jgi:hypothetical protein